MMKKTNQRILAIDWGRKRIGLAIGDSAAGLATPFDVLHITAIQQAIAPILQIIQREQIDQVLIGLPLNMDGSIGPSAAEAIELGRKIRDQSAKPLTFVDERLSSFRAESIVLDRKKQGEKITRKGKRKMLDALAAAAFLQDFLEEKIPALAESDLPSA